MSGEVLCSRGYPESEHWQDGYYCCPARLSSQPPAPDRHQQTAAEVQKQLAALLDNTATGLWMNQDAARQGDRTWGHVVAAALMPTVIAYGAAAEQRGRDEVARLGQAAVEAIREVHQRDKTEPYACDWCGEAWPCTPIRALADRDDEAPT